MTEPLTLAAVGAVAVAEGIKFLYGQVGELFKRRRERAAAGRREAAPEAAAAPVEISAPLPAALGGGTLRAEADLGVVERNERRLAELRGRLADHADGSLDVDLGDGDLLRAVAELRDLVEQALGRHLTFTAERGRPATGSPLVTGRVRAGEVHGAEATGLDVDEMTGGTARGEVEVEVADQGARLTGGRFGRIGPAADRPRPE